ncbi:MAG: uracil-DNA glycosylase [Chitinispirillaceae bacterium]|nr:uracil-DNA glycosylase [Chitinispirillaceae bacterium]
MKEKELLKLYLRQQKELSMPDLIISKNVLSAIPQTPLSNIGIKSKPIINNLRPQAIKSTNRLEKLRPLTKVGSLSQLKQTEKKESKIQIQDALLSPKGKELKALCSLGCKKCPLSEQRKNFVFGSGNADAKIMLIGEAPGREEDEIGLPFVGEAGKLLTKMLSAIDLDREKDVYITNIIKCRPPENRTPEASEILSCLPILLKQIEIIKPDAILLLGRIAAHSLLNKKESIAELRQKRFEFKGIPLYITYHPAALLYNIQYKRPAWEDLKLFRNLLSEKGIYGSLSKK